jgi:hypothetical protein
MAFNGKKLMVCWVRACAGVKNERAKIQSVKLAITHNLDLVFIPRMVSWILFLHRTIYADRSALREPIFMQKVIRPQALLVPGLCHIFRLRVDFYGLQRCKIPPNR